MTRIAVFLVPLVALVAACSSPKQAPAPGPLPSNNDFAQAHVLRTYKVPVELEKQVERLLRGVSYPVQVVSAQGTQTQFVKMNPQLTGNGHIVISAPVGVHEGVAQLIEQLKSTKIVRGPSAIETTYWVVLGWPAKERVIAPDLADATAALEGLSELGPMKFELLDRMQLSAVDGEEASASGNTIDRIKATATLDGPAISLNLAISVGGGKRPSSIDTTVTVKPNHFAVLGQAGYTPENPTLAMQTSGQSGRASLFYIVRARTLP